MRARFLADADLRFSILRGFQRREPQADILSAQEAIPEGLTDPGVLTLAAELGRVLISHDRKTMARHFYEFIQSNHSPGLILIRQSLPTREAIEDLQLIWVWLQTEDFKNQVTYLPLSEQKRRSLV